MRPCTVLLAVGVEGIVVEVLNNPLLIDDDKILVFPYNMYLDWQRQ